MSYVIFTDSSADVASDVLASWGVKSFPLTLRFDGDDKEYYNDDIPVQEFYKRMREGGIPHTAAANVDTIANQFVPELEAGNDVLYLAFSSGLSTTANSGRLAAEELSGRYPDRKVIVIDTLCASTGQGLLVYYAVQNQKAGMDLEANAADVREKIPHIDHWFTVDDLIYLHRGGRVTATAAFAANMLNIKPVLNVDDEGHLIARTKVLGRKASIKAIAQKYKELALDPEHGVYFICHGDCIEDAKLLESYVAEANGGNKCDMFSYTGQVIGSHSGPGTLALFFLGKQR